MLVESGEHTWTPGVDRYARQLWSSFDGIDFTTWSFSWHENIQALFTGRLASESAKWTAMVTTTCPTKSLTFLERCHHLVVIQWWVFWWLVHGYDVVWNFLIIVGSSFGWFDNWLLCKTLIPRRTQKFSLFQKIVWGFAPQVRVPRSRRKRKRDKGHLWW